MSDEELIARYIEPNPHKPTLAEAWLKESAIPVWALIGSLPGVDHDPGALAEAFGIPIEAVQAALAFYDRHRSLIDARLAENETMFEWPYAHVGG
jgi:uncharacterized protein (DUF433 family)